MNQRKNDVTNKRQCRGTVHHAREYGITLIALIITIIVLLILAGVSINLIIGENGILKQTTDAVNIYNQKENDQNQGFNNLNNEFGNYINNIIGNNNGSNGDTGENGNTGETGDGTENVDKNIAISVSPETVGIEKEITIDYGISTLKQYKIGESNTTWSNYTGKINLTSETVITNGWGNTDNTVTIYAKGEDSAGNEQIVQKKILTLDIDAPKAPEISSNYGYPIVTEYGIKLDGETSITYDTRQDITNLYSIDDGKTWQEYKGIFEIPGTGTIIAKSVKSSGLETMVSRTITVPSDAIGPQAYDGDTSTYQTITKGTSKKMKVASSLWEQSISLTLYSANAGSGFENKVELLNSSGDVIWSYNVASAYTWNNKQIDIPEGTEYIRFTANSFDNRFYFQIKEIEPYSTPNITTETNYPIVTENSVEPGHVNATIEYFSTSIQKLYKIDDGEWKEYKGTIRLEIGQTIYAKGIDKYGKESDIESLTAALPSDALEPAAYDGNNSTVVNFKSGQARKIKIDSSMWNKSILLTISSNAGPERLNKVEMKDIAGNVLSSYNTSDKYSWTNHEFVVPDNTAYLQFSAWLFDSRFYFNIYEIGPSTN